MRALIVKVGAVGDVVMALPMITALRRSDPNAQITWLCGAASAPIVRLVDGVEVITLDEARLHGVSAGARGMEVLRTWRRLLGRRFDLVLTGHSDRRYRILSMTTFARTRRAFDRRAGRMWPVPGRYHGDEYCRLVTNVEGARSSVIENPQINAGASPTVLPMLGDSAGDGSRPMVALAPGGARNSLSDSPLRRWPLTAYRQLAQELLGSGFRVTITGSASDEWVRESFRDLNVIDAVGKTSLTELLGLYRSCAVVVTHDSGPMHVAILASVPTVALFGPTAPSEKVPSGRKVCVMVSRTNLACRPCYDGRTYADCADKRCMRDIRVEAVVKAVEKMLGDSAAQSRSIRPDVAARRGHL